MASPPEEIIPLLNDYGEAVITAIHDKSGGNVLKLIGDGVLAILRARSPRRPVGGAEAKSHDAGKASPS